MTDPLVVIVGETASGKSSLAMELAQRFNGEIICADSRTVYTGMDIGTAKPSREDQKQVTHHLLDVVEPDQPFTVSNFQAQAQTVIRDIIIRGKLPILVGGTGLYIDSIVYDFSFRPINQQLRAELNMLTTDELRARIISAGYTLPRDDQNPRHLVRVLESGGASNIKNSTMREQTLMIGVSVLPDELHARISARVAVMVERGLVGEAVRLFEQYGANTRALQTIGYQELIPFLAGASTLADATARITVATRQYAKRQRTWFKRNKSIHWVTKQIQAVDLVTTFLNKK